jgi:cell division protein FtsI/penicillin-binding protein 2
MVNRALAGTYPPGSTFKPFMALAALALGKRRPEQAISDPGYFMFGGHQFRDGTNRSHGRDPIAQAVPIQLRGMRTFRSSATCCWRGVAGIVGPTSLTGILWWRL